MTQLNTPYPATAYLTGFLKQQGYVVTQRNLAIELFLSLLPKQRLEQVFNSIENNYVEFVDFITLEDGERPLLTLLEYLKHQRSIDELV